MKKALLLVLFILFSSQPYAMTDCATGKTIDWIRTGHTENANFNDNNSTVVVKFHDVSQEQVLNIYMNLDNPQGPAILGLLNSAMQTGILVTIRDSNDTCTQFDQIVVHRENYH